MKKGAIYVSLMVMLVLSGCGETTKDTTDSNKQTNTIVTEETNENDSKQIDTISNKDETNKQEVSNDEIKTEKQEEDQENKDETQSTSNNSIRTEFKQAMDSYEQFYNEYIAFMLEYKNDPSNLKLMGKYATMMKQLAQMNDDFDAWEHTDLNTEELKYYIDVQTRVSKKLLDVSL